MRHYKSEIRDKLKEYFLTSLNDRAESYGLLPITSVETGITASPCSTSSNPTLYLYVGQRELSQSFFDSYSVQLGICFGCATPQEGEAMADLWEDAVEDVFRYDRSLGDSALTWTGEPSVRSDGEPGMWMTFIEFNVEYDLGGGRYED